LAGSGPRTVILQAAVNVIRFAHVRGHRIKLTGHKRVDEFPGVTLIVTHVQPAIVSDTQVFAVLWIDPNRVMIAVRDSRLQRLESLAAVRGPAKIEPANEDVLRIAGVDANLAVVHGAIVFGAVVRVEATGNDAPSLSFIIRAPNA